MSRENSEISPVFVEFDDENLEHVLAGPDYGQADSSSFGWTELDSKEYPDFVKSLASKISSNHAKLGI